MVARSDPVFDTFPWPQFAGSREAGEGGEGRKQPSQSLRPSRYILEKIRAVADAARALRVLRRDIMHANGWSLRDLYRTLEIPGDNKLRDAHTALDAAVRAAYGMKPDEDILAFLLQLNLALAEQESRGQPITPPGLPAFVPEPDTFISRDCVRVESGPFANGSTSQSYADAAHFYCAKEEGPPYRIP